MRCTAIHLMMRLSTGLGPGGTPQRPNHPMTTGIHFGPSLPRRDFATHAFNRPTRKKPQWRLPAGRTGWWCRGGRSRRLTLGHAGQHWRRAVGEPSNKRMMEAGRGSEVSAARLRRRSPGARSRSSYSVSSSTSWRWHERDTSGAAEACYVSSAHRELVRRAKARDDGR
jgi:hypothetical protein